MDAMERNLKALVNLARYTRARVDPKRCFHVGVPTYVLN
jgi:hypothetical protein